MVLDNDKPILMVLKNIKNNAPFDFTDSSEYQRETGEALHPKLKNGSNTDKWDVIVWNKNIKQMFVFTCGVKAKVFIEDVKNMLKYPDHKHRVICNSINHKLLDDKLKKINGEWLKDLSDQSGILYLDTIYFMYIIEKVESGIKFRFYNGKIKNSELPFFAEGIIDQNQNKQLILGHSNVDQVFTESNSSINAMCGTWLRLLFFLEFAEVETIIVNNKTRKVKIGSEKILNNTDFNFEIINSNYYTNIIRTEGFGVSGHWRFQPYGTAGVNRKLIWIKDFQKNGYHRKATIVTNKENQ